MRKRKEVVDEEPLPEEEKKGNPRKWKAKADAPPKKKLVPEKKVTPPAIGPHMKVGHTVGGVTAPRNVKQRPWEEESVYYRGRSR
jgi:hypothetical protein